MKTEQMTTIDKVYCVPRTVEEWRLVAPYFADEVEYYGSIESWAIDSVRCGNILLFQANSMLFISKDARDRTEIPAPKFLDLLHDRMVPWRLEEIGFDITKLPYRIEIKGQIDRHIIEVTETGELTFIHGKHMEGITTFTELLQLIKFLTPPKP
jgi:hypothetical protein